MVDLYLVLIIMRIYCMNQNNYWNYFLKKVDVLYRWKGTAMKRIAFYCFAIFIINDFRVPEVCILYYWIIFI